MSLTFKLLSLVIRTAAKPIGNYIKRQAHEHEGFKRFAINQAQRVHRIDMRLRLGLLHDPEAQQRMHEREQKAAEEKKQKEQAPTVRSELEQKKYDEQKAREEKEGKKKDEQPKKRSRPKIRPLSDARAIELGANFFSETFIFLVAVGLLLAENFRSKRAASNRRDEIQDRLESVEAQLERLKQEHNLPELDAPKSKESRPSWWNPAGWWRRSEPPAEDREGGPNQTTESAIPGNVPGPSPQNAVKSADVEKIEPTSNAPHTRLDAVEADTKKR